LDVFIIGYLWCPLIVDEASKSCPFFLGYIGIFTPTLPSPLKGEGTETIGHLFPYFLSPIIKEVAVLPFLSWKGCFDLPAVLLTEEVALVFPLP